MKKSSHQEICQNIPYPARHSFKDTQQKNDLFINQTFSPLQRCGPANSDNNLLGQQHKRNESHKSELLSDCGIQERSELIRSSQTNRPRDKLGMPMKEFDNVTGKKDGFRM